MTGIIDYNAGNIKSVARALDALKVGYCISKSPNDLYQSERLIFPGVGDAQYAMGELRKSGFDVFLKEKAKDETIILSTYENSKIAFEQIKAILCLPWGLFIDPTNDKYIRFLSQKKRRRNNQNEEFHTAILPGLFS